jgi:hypothetical protein
VEGAGGDVGRDGAVLPAARDGRLLDERQRRPVGVAEAEDGVAEPLRGRVPVVVGARGEPLHPERVGAGGHGVGDLDGLAGARAAGGGVGEGEEGEGRARARLVVGVVEVVSKLTVCLTRRRPRVPA